MDGVEQQAVSHHEASSFSSLAFNPELAVDAAAQSGDFSVLAEVLQAASSHPHPAVPLANYFRFVLHHGADLEKQLCDILELLSSSKRVSEDLLRAAVKEAFGVVVAKGSDIAIAALRGCQRRQGEAPAQPLSVAGVAGVRSAPSAQRIGELLSALGSERRDVTFLVLLLQRMPGLPRATVLRALAHAFALTRPPCQKEGKSAQPRIYTSPQARHAALVATDRALTLAFGEVGGSSKRLVGALLKEAGDAQLFVECVPSCGTPILPMKVPKTDDVEFVLAKLTGSSFVLEPRYVGQLVQVHKQGDLLEIYGADQRNLVDSLEKCQVEAVRSALKVRGCILEAIIQESGSFLASDCLSLNGRPLTREGLQSRRTALSKAVEPGDAFEIVHSEEVSMREPMKPDAIKSMLEEARSEGWSGLMLKSLQGEYEAGCTATSCFAVMPSRA